jgi:hypothetical protein
MGWTTGRYSREGVWRAKEYSDNGRTLLWGKSLSEEESKAMDGGEVFTLLDADGREYSKVLKDSYGTIREMGIQ